MKRVLLFHDAPKSLGQLGSTHTSWRSLTMFSQDASSSK